MALCHVYNANNCYARQIPHLLHCKLHIFFVIYRIIIKDLYLLLTENVSIKLQTDKQLK